MRSEALDALRAIEAVLAAKAYARTALAPETLRAYAADWQHFCAWCGTHGCEALPGLAGSVSVIEATPRGKSPAHCVHWLFPARNGT
jgi:hypothetical protein